ncbi:MAG: hypothetical protein ABSB18_07345 [Candidatus Omnitrophota bacterium]
MSNKPIFNPEEAKSLIGKYCLIGLNYCDHQGKPLEKKQLHGDIIRANENEGVVLKLRGSGEEFKLPPDLKAFKKAEPGEYRLKSTGETIISPDLIATWDINKPSLE